MIDYKSYAYTSTVVDTSVSPSDSGQIKYTEVIEYISSAEDWSRVISDLQNKKDSLQSSDIESEITILNESLAQASEILNTVTAISE